MEYKTTRRKKDPADQAVPKVRKNRDYGDERSKHMNNALLNSKKLDWCTPADFFAELDQEFHFDLNPVATEVSGTWCWSS